MTTFTAPQLTAIKAEILGDPTLSSQPNDGNGLGFIADALNAVVPSFIVWKSLVSIAATGQAFNGTELANMTTGNLTRLQTIAMYLAGGYNPSITDVRQMFNDIYSGAGGQITRAALLVLWKRSALRIEKILVVGGAGTDASPATLGYEGRITPTEVDIARRS
jgi:hypothetical protein